LAKGETADKIRLFSDKKVEESTTQIGTRLLNDDKFRREFISDPNKALTKAGLKDLGKIKLSKRDVALLNLIGDKKINELYRSGKFEDLEKHIFAEYAEFVNPLDIVSVAVADFDVVIEAEAVAVAVVAIAAVVVGAVERFSEINVLQARIAALETRLKSLETKLG